MTFRFLRRLGLAAAVAVVPWAVVGCGDSGVATSIPATTPPIPTDAKGKPMPPPSAASVPSPKK